MHIGTVLLTLLVGVALATNPHARIFAPGTLPLDDSSGQQVHAHGGQLIKHEGTYYWLGTSQKKPPYWFSRDVNLYASDDLSSWRFVGSILSWELISSYPWPPPYRIERPKVRAGPY